MDASYFEPSSFLYHYLLTRLRNDKEGEFNIGIDAYQVLLNALYTERQTLTLERLPVLVCLLFAKSRMQQVRLMQHFNIVLAEYRQIMELLKETGTKQHGTHAGATAEKEKEEMDKEKDDDMTPDAGKDPVKQITRKSAIQRQIARITLNPPLYTGKYAVSQKYVPASKREMGNCSRRLYRGFGASAVSDQIDIDKTIAAIARQGFFLSPVSGRRKQKGSAYVLIDNSNSMVPFEKLVHDYYLSLQSYVQITALYFNNYPAQNLYREKLHVNAIGMEAWLAGISRYSVIIVVSDAGAARGSYNDKRILGVEKWGKEVMERTGRVVWINPMPAGRWLDSSAEAIRKTISMYSFTRYSLEKAMQALTV